MLSAVFFACPSPPARGCCSEREGMRRRERSYTDTCIDLERHRYAQRCTYRHRYTQTETQRVSERKG